MNVVRSKKTAYELSKSQVKTPESIVGFVWKLMSQYRSRPTSVLDLGAGDCRFAVGGKYTSYQGVEIDPIRSKQAVLPARARLNIGCAFNYRGSGYGVCIGNPPYVRHHDLDEVWRDKIASRLSKSTGVEVNRKSNLYVYFMTLGLLKTTPDGLVAVVVPYEWASRPSATALRQYIADNKWHVDIYRFKDDIFGSVLTTASVSIIDKRNRDGLWQYYDIDATHEIREHNAVTLSTKKLLPYENRGHVWALRGMSPGTQAVFTMTEGERIHAGLKREDVLPCVTTFRNVPKSLSTLSMDAFRVRFVDAGERCWLIRSHESLSLRLKEYLDHVPIKLRSTWTCNNRKPWYRFDLHPCPQLLVATGFTAHGPKVLVNQVGAYAIGSVCGIHTDKPKLPVRRLQQFLCDIDFEKRVVAHSGQLKKIEIRQLNTVLNCFASRWLHE